MTSKILKLTVFLSLFVFISCKKETEKTTVSAVKNSVEYAKGFQLYEYPDFTVLKVTQPWQDAKETFTYVLANDLSKIPDSLKNKVSIQIPVKTAVVTSTTHIPSLVALGESEALVGFPHLEYISSEVIRKNINAGKIKELNDNESVNLELTIDLNPEVIVAHSMEANNQKIKSLENAGLKVLLNGDWIETTPLGKAEWIKFFGVLFDKNQEAAVYFNSIVTDYNQAKELVKDVKELPVVFSGSMYQDVWYAPQGESWMAYFIKDAKGQYIWADTKGTGSLSLSFETVLDKAQNAEIWIGPGQFTSYEELKNNNKHYTEFSAYKNRKVFTYSAKKGPTGGVIFYEEAPNRPDLILKDLIFILHPEKLPEYTPYFIEALQ